MNWTVGHASLLAAGLFSAALLTAAPVFAGDTRWSDPRLDASWNNVQPAYPDSAQASGEEGSVDIALYVNPRGKPKKLRIVQSSGFEDLDDAAVDAVLNWKFVPATYDGDTVSQWTTVRIVFRLPRPAQNKPAT
ncbi:MAG: energy transducer TonB [Proteobacteria bacterium]|nr:energy transducer TonB [Pseudomonadota bacterium]